MAVRPAPVARSRTLWTGKFPKHGAERGQETSEFITAHYGAPQVVSPKGRFEGSYG